MQLPDCSPGADRNSSNFGRPNEFASLANWARSAEGYDASRLRIEPRREEAVPLLGLRPCDPVLDVACGTGKGFALLCVGAGSSVVANAARQSSRCGELRGGSRLQRRPIV